MKLVNFEPLSPLLFLERASRIYKDRYAFVDNSAHKTYSEFYQDCCALAANFKNQGVGEGDKIAYLSRNNYQMLVAHYAVPMLGGVLVPINMRLDQKTVCHILDHSESKILVVEEDLFCIEYMQFIENAVVIAKKKSSLVNKNIHDYNDFMIRDGNGNKTVDFELNDENATISINYTSGTTGHPKGVMYSHRSAYLNSLGECLQAGLNNQSKYLWVLPMFHCNGWCYTWAITAVGATHYCVYSFNPDDLVNAILENKITHLCAAPIILQILLGATNFSLLKQCENLKIITAGSSPPKQIIERCQELNITIIHVYGLTETYGPHSICEPQDDWSVISNDELAARITRQGVAGIHSSFLRVVDKSMQDVPHDGITVGEVIMRGNNVMQGYYKDPEGTQAAFNGGWFRSGDAAVINADGYIEIKDRIKDIIISGGENISSIEVEKVLCQHHAILFAAVIPMYDEYWGEVPHAIVELRQGLTMTDKEVIEFCKRHLASFKCPKMVTFTILPKTSTGKIEKYRLKKEYYHAEKNEMADIA